MALARPNARPAPRLEPVRLRSFGPLPATARTPGSMGGRGPQAKKQGSTRASGRGNPRDPAATKRGQAERRVLGISLQMNIAPRSAVIPPGTLVNVGMFAATKCRENRILRLVTSPPPPNGGQWTAGRSGRGARRRKGCSRGYPAASSVRRLCVGESEPGEGDRRESPTHPKKHCGWEQHP